MKIRNIDWKSIVHEEIELDEFDAEGKSVSKHISHKQHSTDDPEASGRKHMKPKRLVKSHRLGKQAMIDIGSQ